jgi:hypothetical protein
MAKTFTGFSAATQSSLAREFTHYTLAQLRSDLAESDENHTLAVIKQAWLLKQTMRARSAGIQINRAMNELLSIEAPSLIRELITKFNENHLTLKHRNGCQPPMSSIKYGT